ncbi:DUF4442 domain-containing protein [Bdellovibrio sp. qaytius]|nr:DUF4442 domain-containing protein [Bdellovibrio sp. qaytius]
MAHSLEILKTTNTESFKSKSFRRAMNWYPMFFATGAKVLFWSGDWSEVQLRLTLNIWTRNYVKTIFGGSMFSATDPFNVIMFMHMLGKDFVVWDKSASIKFKRPGKDPLYALFKITPEVLEKVKAEVQASGETTHIASIQWIDKDKNVYAELERHIYIADKKFYKEKLEKRKLTKGT